jgi:hypothetical protein
VPPSRCLQTGMLVDSMLCWQPCVATGWHRVHVMCCALQAFLQCRPQSRESCSVAYSDSGHVQMCSHVLAARWHSAHHPHSCTIKRFWAVCLHGKQQVGYGTAGYGREGCVGERQGVVQEMHCGCVWDLVIRCHIACIQYFNIGQDMPPGVNVT